MFAFFSSSVEQNCLQLISFSFFIFYYTFLRFEKRTAPRECVCLFTRIIWKCFCGEAVDIKWIENGREGWGGESWINKSTVDDTFSSLSESSSSRWRHCWSNYRNIDKLSARSVIHAIIPFPFFTLSSSLAYRKKGNRHSTVKKRASGWMIFLSFFSDGVFTYISEGSGNVCARNGAIARAHSGPGKYTRLPLSLDSAAHKWITQRLAYKIKTVQGKMRRKKKKIRPSYRTSWYIFDICVCVRECVCVSTDS